MFGRRHNDEDSISISAPKRDACAFVTRTNLGHSGSIGIYTRRILFLMCWWGVAFVRRKNYGSRFQKRFARLAGPRHKPSQQKDKDGTLKCGRLHDHSWLRSGAEIATLPRRPPNQTTLPRAGRLSRLTFRKTSCVMPTKRSAAAIRRLRLDWANHKPRRFLLLACHRRRRQPVGFSVVCFLSRRWIKPAITPAAFVQSGESRLLNRLPPSTQV